MTMTTKAVLSVLSVVVVLCGVGVVASVPPVSVWGGGGVSGDEVVEVRLALATDAQMAVLEEMALAVSLPNSPEFRKFKTFEEVKAVMAVDPEVRVAVSSWLTTEAQVVGAVEWAPMDDYVTFSTSAATAQSLFGVAMQHFTHIPTGKTIIRSTSPYTIPSALQGLVRAVDHVTFEAGPDTPVVRRSRDLKDEPGMDITPPILHELYSIPNATASASYGSQACAEFEGAQFNPSDVKAFQAKYGYPNNPVKVVGPNNGGYFGEASLDEEYITTVAPGIPSWNFGLNAFDLVKWGHNVTGTPNAPKMHSISWGSEESGFDTNTLVSVNSEFMKMGSMGFTIMTASGDSGTGNDGFFKCKFQPTFPATSPWVTAVGGTYITSVGAPEIGWSSSGGGVSNFFGRPQWQASVVGDYLSSTPNLPDSSYYNHTGRGIPDVSAASTNFMFLIAGSLGPISGTSAATPTFTATLSMIQADRLSKSKAPLGHVAPALYQAAAAMTDITSGNNKVPLSPCKSGFPATKGWDAITGLGTPNYPALYKALA